MVMDKAHWITATPGSCTAGQVAWAAEQCAQHEDEGMTDTLIEEIKRNREAGTPGKWRVEYKNGNTRLIMEDHPDPCQMCDETYYPWTPDNLDDWERIAAVPDMEARILADAEIIKAAEELAYRMDQVLTDLTTHGGYAYEDDFKDEVAALAVFRAAQEKAKAVSEAKP